jgi:hypothetical protein
MKLGEPGSSNRRDFAEERVPNEINDELSRELPAHLDGNQLDSAQKPPRLRFEK